MKKTFEKFTIVVWNFSYTKEVHIEIFLRSNDSFMTSKLNKMKLNISLIFALGNEGSKFQGTNKCQTL